MMFQMVKMGNPEDFLIELDGVRSELECLRDSVDSVFLFADNLLCSFNELLGLLPVIFLIKYEVHLHLIYHLQLLVFGNGIIIVPVTTMSIYQFCVKASRLRKHEFKILGAIYQIMIIGRTSVHPMYVNGDHIFKKNLLQRRLSFFD